jgi:hypothetical protein
MSANENITAALRDFVRDVIPPEGRSEQALYTKFVANEFGCDLSLVRAAIRDLKFDALPDTPGEYARKLNREGYRKDLKHDYLNYYGMELLNEYRYEASPFEDDDEDLDYGFLHHFFMQLAEKSGRKPDEVMLSYLKYAGCYQADVDRMVQVFTETGRNGSPADNPKKHFPMTTTPEYVKAICIHFGCIEEALLEARQRIMQTPTLLEKTFRPGEEEDEEDES